VIKEYSSIPVFALLDFEDNQADQDMPSEDFSPFPAVPNYKVTVQTFPHIKPKQRNFSIIPKSLEKEAKQQIKEWLQQGVISRVEYTHGMWISALLVIQKPNGKARCCVDFVEVN
jgi:hypothetical protein